VIGQREAPGRPALFATTKAFLDDLGLRSLDELPPLESDTTVVAPAEFELQFAAAVDAEHAAQPQAAAAQSETQSAATDTAAAASPSDPLPASA